jgi:hypothetical protein
MSYYFVQLNDKIFIKTLNSHIPTGRQICVEVRVNGNRTEIKKSLEILLGRVMGAL